MNETLTRLFSLSPSQEGGYLLENEHKVQLRCDTWSPSGSARNFQRRPWLMGLARTLTAAAAPPSRYIDDLQYAKTQ